jgi:hypothetical protein
MLSKQELLDIRQVVREEIRCAIGDFLKDARIAAEEVWEEKRIPA